MKTLADYMTAAQLGDQPAWAGAIRLKFPPRSYQIDDLNYLACAPRGALFHEMGTGKTFPIQAIMLWYVGLGNRCVAIMPPTLVRQFEASYHTSFRGAERHVRIERLPEDVRKRSEAIAQWKAHKPPDILLMSYNAFKPLTEKQAAARTRADMKRFRALQKKLADGVITKVEFDLKRAQMDERMRSSKEAAEFSYKTLMQLGFTYLFCDEGHALKHPSSWVHKSVKDFLGKDGPESNGICLATGSPVGNNPEDAYGLFALLDPKRYGSFRAFERLHVKLVFGCPFRKVEGYHNLDYLHQGLAAIGRRVTKAQVMKELPPKMYTEYSVELHPDHMELYRKLVKEQVLILPDNTMIDATNASSLRQKLARIIANPEEFDPRAFADNALFQLLDDLMDSLAPNKVVLFAWYKSTIKKLLARYRKHNPVALYGEITGTKREAARKRFIDDPSCTLLVAQPASGGVGVDGLQDVCSHAIWVEPTAVPMLFGQANDRLHRGGQTLPVNIYLLTVAKTVSVHLRNSLLRKEEQAEEVVRDKTVLLRQLLDEAPQGEFR